MTHATARKKNAHSTERAGRSRSSSLRMMSSSGILDIALRHGRLALLSAIFQLDCDLVSQHARFHPADRQQITKRFEEAVPHAVFALAMQARIVADGNLDDAGSFHFQKR